MVVHEKGGSFYPFLFVEDYRKSAGINRLPTEALNNDFHPPVGSRGGSYYQVTHHVCGWELKFNAAGNLCLSVFLISNFFVLFFAPILEH